MPSLQVVKIGGAIIEEENKLSQFIRDFALLKGPKILVHGGGKKASIWAKKLQIPIRLKEGRRLTDRPTLELITGLYGGQVNKNVVVQLQAHGCNAVGLSGADGNVICAEKRPVKSIDYGYVGDVTQVNTSFIELLLSKGITPVFCAITHDGNGQLLNTNADTITSEIGKAMASTYTTTIRFCFEIEGVLRDLDNPNSLIEKIDEISYQELLLNNVISSGMLPKLHNAFEALHGGVKEVAIGKTSMLTESIPYTSITLK